MTVRVNKMPAHRCLPLLLLLSLAFSCSQPPSREMFIRSDGSGEYVFPLQLPDTLAAYDISFYTVIDRPVFRADTIVSFPMQVVWRSPSGRYFSETVHYPADSVKVRYRSGVIPSEEGDWTLSVTLDPEPGGLRGLGVICALAD